LTPRKIALAVVAALAFAAPTAMAQQEVPDTVDVSGGVTKLALGAKAKRALRSAGVTLSGRRFAITDGEIDPADGNRADIAHQGRLVFRAGKRRVGFRQLSVELADKGALLGTSAGEVVTVANLTGGSVARQGRAAARTLNRVLRVSGFRRGMVLGTVSVDAQLTEALVDAAGDTDLQISPQAAQKLAAEGISAAPVAPAEVATGPGGLPIFSFPIAGGTVKLDQSAANVNHNGGLVLSKGSTQIPLSLPAVEINTPPTPSVLTVDLGGTRAAAADLDLTNMTRTGTANGLEVGGVVLKLTASAATVLNAAFQTQTFQAGDVLGTTSSSLTFK
jgi:hypothetical protein